MRWREKYRIGVMKTSVWPLPGGHDARYGATYTSVRFPEEKKLRLRDSFIGLIKPKLVNDSVNERHEKSYRLLSGRQECASCSWNDDYPARDNYQSGELKRAVITDKAAKLGNFLIKGSGNNITFLREPVVA